MILVDDIVVGSAFERFGRTLQSIIPWTLFEGMRYARYDQVDQFWRASIHITVSVEKGEAG